MAEKVYSDHTKMLKMADFDPTHVQNLISRKILVEGKLSNFPTVVRQMVLVFKQNTENDIFTT